MSLPKKQSTTDIRILGYSYIWIFVYSYIRIFIYSDIRIFGYLDIQTNHQHDDKSQTLNTSQPKKQSTTDIRTH